MPEINQITDLNGTTYDIRDTSKVNSNQGAANAGKALGIDSTGAVVPVPFSGEDFTGATSSTDGTHGYVPAPEAGMQQYFLKADGTWDAPPGTKLVEKMLDTVTNTSGSYTHTTTISDVSSDMKAVMIELSNPSAFLSDITITPADGSITLSCSSVEGTSTVKVGLLFVAGTSAITSSEFDVLAGRIGTLGDLQTTAKTSLVAAVNENTDAIADLDGRIANINTSTSISNLTNIPVNTKGRIKIAGTASPTGGGTTVDYICIGNNSDRTLIIDYIANGTMYINRYTSSAWSGWQQLATGDDIADINTALAEKVNTSNIANNLTTTAAGKVLDARQGKTLNDSISEKVNTSDIANNLTTTAAGKVLDARQGKTLNNSLSGKIPYPSSYATTWLASSTSATTKYTTTSAGWFYITCNANDGDHGFQIGGVKITKIGSYIFPCKSGVEITLIGNSNYATTLYKVS